VVEIRLLVFIVLLILIIGANIKKTVKGKLLDCFNNRKREYKKAGIITSTPRHSPSIECNLDALRRLNCNKAYLKI